MIKKKLAAAAAIAAAVLSGLLLFLFSLGGTQYDDLNKARAREMEELYGITVTEDITLGHYSADMGFGDEKVLTVYADGEYIMELWA